MVVYIRSVIRFYLLIIIIIFFSFFFTIVRQYNYIHWHTSHNRNRPLSSLAPIYLFVYMYQEPFWSRLKVTIILNFAHANEARNYYN